MQAAKYSGHFSTTPRNKSQARAVVKLIIDQIHFSACRLYVLTSSPAVFRPTRDEISFRAYVTQLKASPVSRFQHKSNDTPL